MLSSLLGGLILGGCASSSDEASETTLSGYFIDAAVAGVEYNTSSGITGITDTLGRFQYKNGDTVTLHIGNLILGDAVPQLNGLVTPLELSSDENVTALMLRTLQALDSDDNLSNGIEVDPAVTEALQNLSQIRFEEIGESELLSLSTELSQEVDEDGDGTIDIDNSAAHSHFEESKRDWETRTQSGDTSGFDLSIYPLSTLTQEIKDTLAYMGNEERLAYDLYSQLYEYHLQNSDVELKQLYNIAQRSEAQHIEIVRSLVERYDLNASDFTVVDEAVAPSDTAIEDMPSGVYGVVAVQELYDTLIAKGKVSTQNALEVGCMVEVTDVNDLDRDIALAKESNASDVVAAFEVLKNGSYNHYWAFDKGLKNMGVLEGCCSLGEEYCKTLEEYPKTSGQGH